MKITKIRAASKTLLALLTILPTVPLALSAANAATTHHATAHHARITMAQANAIALKKFPGKLTQKTTLENEEGAWQYGVMVRSGRTLREVMVDAHSGKIANVEVTSGAQENREQRAEDAAAKKAAHAKRGAK